MEMTSFSLASVTTVFPLVSAVASLVVELLSADALFEDELQAVRERAITALMVTAKSFFIIIPPFEFLS